MAIEGGLIPQMGRIFTFLLVFVVGFGILEVTRIFGEGKAGVNALVALLVAFLANLSPRFIAIMEFVAPWFIMTFIVLFFMGLGIKFLGEDKEGFGVLKEPGVMWIIFLILGIIVLMGFIRTADMSTAPEASSGLTIDPTIGGVVVIFLIALFTVVFLTTSPPKKKD